MVRRGIIISIHLQRIVSIVGEDVSHAAIIKSLSSWPPLLCFSTGFRDAFACRFTFKDELYMIIGPSLHADHIFEDRRRLGIAV